MLPVSKIVLIIESSSLSLDAILLQLVAVDILSSLVKWRLLRNKLRSKTRELHSKTRATSVSSDMGLRKRFASYFYLFTCIYLNVGP